MKKLKIYSYNILWELRQKEIKRLFKSKSKTTLKELWKWEKSKKFVTLEDYLELSENYVKLYERGLRK